MDNTGVRVDYENALINAGFGKFHFFLLAVSGMIYMNTAIGITIISFVLPSAACDFQMTSQDKGLLTAAPMMGKCVLTAFIYFRQLISRALICSIRNVIRILFLGLLGRHKRQKGGVDRNSFT